MTGKLIKYDLKAMLKTMLPLWIALPVVSVLFGIRLLFTQPDSGSVMMDGEAGISVILLFMLLFGVLVAVLVLNIILVVQRFWHGLLKDEGYLMFTLPVSPRWLIISKAVSALIIFLISGLITFLCLLIISWLGMVSIRQNMTFFWFTDLWAQIRQTFHADSLRMTGWVFLWLLGGITDLLENIYHAYAAMAIGQLSNKNRFLVSIIAYLVLSMAVSTIVAIPIAILSAMSGGTDIGFHWFSLSTNSLTVGAMLLGILVNILTFLGYHAATEYLLTKKLNLE